MTEPKEQFQEREWRCVECGYVHIGENPPKQCPKCHASSEVFVPIEETEEEARNGK